MSSLPNDLNYLLINCFSQTSVLLVLIPPFSAISRHWKVLLDFMIVCLMQLHILWQLEVCGLFCKTAPTTCLKFTEINGNALKFVQKCNDKILSGLRILHVVVWVLKISSCPISPLLIVVYVNLKSWIHGMSQSYTKETKKSHYK